MAPTERPVWMRQIVSASIGATLSMVKLGRRFSGGMGMVSVVISSTMGLSRSRSTAPFDSTGWTVTEDDGAWVKNTGEESQMVDAMRKGTSFVITSESSRGTKTTDTYSLKGISEALDKVAAECK